MVFRESYYSIESFVGIRAIRVFSDLGPLLDEIYGHSSGDSDLLPITKRLKELKMSRTLQLNNQKERPLETEKRFL